MRDHQGGPTPGEFGQCRLDLTLGVIVQRAGCLIEDEDPRIAQNGAGDGDPLTLAAGESVPSGADERVQPIWERRHDTLDLRRAQGCPDLLVVRIRLGQQQVGADRVVNQIGLL